MSERGGPDWCWWHERAEPVPASGYFKICFECWHCFDTEKDLVDEYNKGLAAIGLARRAVSSSDDIWDCPFCAHSF
jgi:hypothetical protein